MSVIRCPSIFFFPENRISHMQRAKCGTVCCDTTKLTIIIFSRLFFILYFILFTFITRKGTHDLTNTMLKVYKYTGHVINNFIYYRYNHYQLYVYYLITSH